MYLGPYTKYRQHFLGTYSATLVARLGWNAFSSAIRANPALFLYSVRGQRDAIRLLDGTAENSVDANTRALLTKPLISLTAGEVLQNPDARFIARQAQDSKLLLEYADARSGLHAGDLNQFFGQFWEVARKGDSWELAQTAVSNTEHFGGREKILLWEKESGRLAALAESVKHLNHAAQNWRAGKPFWGKRGIIIGLMGNVDAALYTGEPFDSNSSALVPNDPRDLPAIWAFCESGEFSRAVRSIDKSLKLAPKTLLKIPFDVERWRQRAIESYPDGLPKPYADDVTQWNFHGHPQPSTCLLYTSPSPRDRTRSRMPSSA